MNMIKSLDEDGFTVAATGEDWDIYTFKEQPPSRFCPRCLLNSVRDILSHIPLLGRFFATDAGFEPKYTMVKYDDAHVLIAPRPKPNAPIYTGDGKDEWGKHLQDLPH